VTRHRRRQPEGWGGQTHHRHQPRRVAGRDKRRVLLCRLDAQGNATMGVGVDKYKLAKTTRDVAARTRPGPAA